MEDRFHNTSNNLGYEEEIESEDDAPILRLETKLQLHDTIFVI